MTLKDVARSLSFRRSSKNAAESSILSDYVPSESRRFTKYENLSKSMILEGFVVDQHYDYRDLAGVERSDSFGWKQKWRSMSFDKRVSPKIKIDEIAEKQRKPTKSASEPTEPKLKTKKRSSWLPNPRRRWPIQGW
eukprot:Gb_06590 [translate_table: standard]